MSSVLHAYQGLLGSEACVATCCDPLPVLLTLLRGHSCQLSSGSLPASVGAGALLAAASGWAGGCGSGRAPALGATSTLEDCSAAVASRVWLPSVTDGCCGLSSGKVAALAAFFRDFLRACLALLAAAVASSSSCTLQAEAPRLISAPQEYDMQNRADR